LFFTSQAFAQLNIRGKVIDAETEIGLAGVEIFNQSFSESTLSGEGGIFQFRSEQDSATLIFFIDNYRTKTLGFSKRDSGIKTVKLSPFAANLNAVEITANRRRTFELTHLKDVEGTSIFAGKKSEVILVDQSMANLATNNARQIYSQVAGLNIYQNDDAGLQLNIGGRGLDPNRTANFNTRQNGYDISADVLGYHESYYAPASEGISRIQVVRGAASLQYGTQFGGLINFIMKKPKPNDPLEIISRNTVGSYGLYTNFTSLSGTKKKFSYYTFFNYKRGDGFRSNSDYESKNFFSNLNYQLSEKTKLSVELTYLDYLAQQAGGLTDDLFEEDPFFSNRSRNWFKVDWLLYNFKLNHQFDSKKTLSFNFFGLNASRYALGFRTNRVSQIDPGEERDLIKNNFRNFGFEGRYLSKYKLFGKKTTSLIGMKYYDADNDQVQGPGSSGSGADFNLARDEFPNYANQSNFDLPNLNIALFGEQIFYLSEKLSITPGFRFEYLKTESEGSFKRINTDGAGNVILNEEIPDNNSFERNILLLGLGLSYKMNKETEFYFNLSENYRSVTFADINITNPAFVVSPDITDEDGFTIDLGARGKFNQYISYNLGVFALFYNNRIGFVQKGLSDGRVVSERNNIGDARMLGFESLVDFNLKKVLTLSDNFSFNFFVNYSVIQSEYTDSEQNGIAGNEVEFVPEFNLKTGLKFGYKNLRTSLQYSYLSQQFTDASNAVESNLSGVIGAIPSYGVLDFSASYKFKRFTLESGLNNALNNFYFTRRATGYPGPGIIPSPPRNWYLGLEIKF